MSPGHFQNPCSAVDDVPKRTEITASGGQMPVDLNVESVASSDTPMCSVGIKTCFNSCFWKVYSRIAKNLGPYKVI